jgi:hypothetical protein
MASLQLLWTSWSTQSSNLGKPILTASEVSITIQKSLRTRGQETPTSKLKNARAEKLSGKLELLRRKWLMRKRGKRS